MARSSAFDRLRPRVVAVVAAVPEGRVTTYGDIARHLGVSARQVAFVLSNLTPEESRDLPWFRVVAASGVISSVKVGSVGGRQLARLRAEGVSVARGSKVADFQAVLWSPGV